MPRVCENSMQISTSEYFEESDTDITLDEVKKGISDSCNNTSDE